MCLLQRQKGFTVEFPDRFSSFRFYLLRIFLPEVVSASSCYSSKHWWAREWVSRGVIGYVTGDGRIFSIGQMRIFTYVVYCLKDLRGKLLLSFLKKVFIKVFSQTASLSLSFFSHVYFWTKRTSYLSSGSFWTLRTMNGPLSKLSVWASTVVFVDKFELCFAINRTNCNTI